MGSRALFLQSCAIRFKLRPIRSPKNSMLTFVRNRGELAEGWYDPATLQKATESAAKSSNETASGRRASPDYGSPPKDTHGSADSSDEDDFGPALPGTQPKHMNHTHRSGPTIPTLQDLELQRGTSFRL